MKTSSRLTEWKPHITPVRKTVLRVSSADVSAFVVWSGGRPSKFLAASSAARRPILQQLASFKIGLSRELIQLG